MKGPMLVDLTLDTDEAERYRQLAAERMEDIAQLVRERKVNAIEVSISQNGADVLLAVQHREVDVRLFTRRKRGRHER